MLYIQLTFKKMARIQKKTYPGRINDIPAHVKIALEKEGKQNIAFVCYHRRLHCDQTNIYITNQLPNTSYSNQK